MLVRNTCKGELTIYIGNRILNYKRRHFALALMLLSIFVFHYASINFFSHTHIINGVTIVHSHIYRSTPDKDNNASKSNPGHTHTANELTLIAELSNFQILVIPVISLVLILLLILLYSYRPEIEYHTLNNRFHLKSSPRSPPILMS